MVKLTNIMIYIAHVCIGIGIFFGMASLSTFLGMFSLPVVLFTSAPVLALWFIIVTFWNKYVRDAS